jgi:hypothetical protein
MKNKMNFKVKNNGGSIMLWVAITIVILGVGAYFMFSSKNSKSNYNNIINTQDTTKTVTRDVNGTKLEINYTNTSPEDTSKYTPEQMNILRTLKAMNSSGN